VLAVFFSFGNEESGISLTLKSVGQLEGVFGDVFVACCWRTAPAAFHPKPENRNSFSRSLRRGSRFTYVDKINLVRFCIISTISPAFSRTQERLKPWENTDE